MKEDRVTPDMSTEKLIFKATEPYECNMGAVAEAPYIIKKDGIYYMTYSGSNFLSPFYCVAYATSENPLEGFVKYKNNPILVGDGKTISGIGHHCITYSADKKRMFIVYHAHDDALEYHTRHLSISEIYFAEEKGEIVLKCNPHTFEEQPYPAI